MDIVIKIPKEFEKDFNEDKFEDCLARLASDIEAFGFRSAGRYEKETVTMLRKAFKNGKPLPNGKSILVIDTPKTCGDCPCCIFTAEEKRAIGFCNTSNEDYYCKLLEGFRKYDEVDGGVDILGKPSCCPLESDKEG